MVLFYLLGATAIFYGVANHPELMFRDPPVTVPQRVEQSPDSVPNHISCQFRGESFCHPKRYDV